MGAVTARQRLLDASKLRVEGVEIDGYVYRVQEVSAAAFASFAEAVQKDRQAAVAGLLAECLIDEHGKPLLSADEARRVANSARVSVPLVNALMEISGFGENKPDASRALRIPSGSTAGPDGSGDAR